MHFVGADIVTDINLAGANRKLAVAAAAIIRRYYRGLYKSSIL